MLVGVADAGFVRISGGWLIGFQLGSGAGIFPLCVTGLSLLVVDPSESRGRDWILLLTLLKEEFEVTFALWWQQ